jgi:hypothetical protein
VAGRVNLPAVLKRGTLRRAPAAEADRSGDAYYPSRIDRRTNVRPPLHFQRIELKFFLPDRALNHFVDRLSAYTEVDPYLVREGRGRTSYPVTSLYFDSYDLQAFDEKEGGQLFRRKIRLRTYEESLAPENPCFLEIKRRLDAVVLKDRLGLPAGVLDPSIPVNRLLSHLFERTTEKDSPTYHEARMMAAWLNLQPTAIVRYKRLAFVGRDNPTTRITVDLNMEGVWKPPKVVGDIPLRSIGNINAAGMSGISGRYGMLELKCNRNVPGWFHRAAQDLELTRTAFSKYYLVVSALRPQVMEDCDGQYVRGAA